MTAQDIVILLGAFCALLASLGAAAKWSLAYVDRKATDAEARAETARGSMLAHLEERISALSETVRLLSSRENLYLKRVLQLEAYIQGQQGWQMPSLDGWPPQ